MNNIVALCLGVVSWAAALAGDADGALLLSAAGDAEGVLVFTSDVAVALDFDGAALGVVGDEARADLLRAGLPFSYLWKFYAERERVRLYGAIIKNSISKHPDRIIFCWISN